MFYIISFALLPINLRNTDRALYHVLLCITFCVNLKLLGCCFDGSLFLIKHRQHKNDPKKKKMVSFWIHLEFSIRASGGVRLTTNPCYFFILNSDNLKHVI